MAVPQSLQAQREQANRRGEARLDERQRRQELKRAAEQGGAGAGPAKRIAAGEAERGPGGEAGPSGDEYGSLRLGSAAKAFVSTAGQHGFTCALCQVTLPSQQLYQQHLAGPAHAKAVRARAAEEERRRRGIGGAHDAVAGAQWTSMSSAGAARDRPDGGGGLPRAPAFRGAGGAAAAAAGEGAPAAGEGEPALPKHISSHRKRPEAEMDLSIDGWVPPMPTVRDIDEDLVIGAAAAVPAAAAAGDAAEPARGDEAARSDGAAGDRAPAPPPRADAHRPPSTAEDEGSPGGPAKPFALVDYDSDDSEC